VRADAQDVRADAQDVRADAQDVRADAQDPRAPSWQVWRSYQAAWPLTGGLPGSLAANGRAARQPGRLRAERG
jgi:hypothetical protein